MHIDLDTYLRVQKITCTEYDTLGILKDKEQALIDSNTVESMIDDLICEIERLNEHIEDMEQDIKDNYKRVPVSEQVGIGNSDFI